MLILVVAAVALMATAVVNRLGSPPGEQARSNSPTWLAALLGGAFAGAMGYLGSALEEYGLYLVALAVMGPLTAAAWEQRFREARVYRPDAMRALRDEETWDNPARDDSVFAGLRDEHITARGNS
ncbi:MAG: hypothetical protein OXH15_08890 [Gammaproteobacteria bacterium]|nr:hypothetical protein [Gammaproteobacteria bacterium]